MRKTTAIIITLLMLLPLVLCGMNVSAAEGTAVRTADEFLGMQADGTYYLDADIEINMTYSAKFTGTFDGNGHKVTVSCPMFAVFDGTIKNLTVNGTITATDGLSVAAVAVRTVDGMYAENVTTNVNITLSGERRGMYAAGILATDNIVALDNTNNYGGKQEANNKAAVSAFIKCKNTGNITVNASLPAGADANEPANMKPRAGGIAAVVEGIYCIECENTGNISIPFGNLTANADGTYTYDGLTSAICAGIVARSGLTAGGTPACFYGCKNSGEITAYGNAAGIDGYAGCKGNSNSYVFYGCVNTGKIVGLYEAGGIASYVYGQSLQYSDIEYCLNTGDIYYGRYNDLVSYGSPFIAYTNTLTTTISGNISTGTVQEFGNGYTAFGHSFIGVSSADPLYYTLVANVIYDPEGHFTMYSMTQNPTTDSDYTKNRHTISEATTAGILTVLKSLTDVKSGKVAYDVNAAYIKANGGTLKGTATWTAGKKTDGTFKYSGEYIYEYVWRQKLGTDEVPTVNNIENGYVTLQGDKYVNASELKIEVAETTAKISTKKVETTKSPETTAAPGDVTTSAPGTEASKTEEKSGCGSSAAIGAFLVVAILGTAVVRKKD